MNEKKRKIAINASFGGFDLSPMAARLLKQLLPEDKRDEEDLAYEYCTNHKLRDAPELIQVIELLGDEASLCPGDIKIVEIPYDVEWIIQEYDGEEWVAEAHRSWR